MNDILNEDFLPQWTDDYRFFTTIEYEYTRGLFAAWVGQKGRKIEVRLRHDELTPKEAMDLAAALVRAVHG